MREMDFFLNYLKHYQPFKERWNYEDGCVLEGAGQMYAATGDEAFRSFVLDYLCARVLPDGSIPSFIADEYSTDDILPGRALFFALKETGEERYRKALDYHFERLQAHPRCVCGSFWHKSRYPNQIWLDGLYMMQPFYMAYDTLFGGRTHYKDIALQFQNARQFLHNPEKGLSYHGYDESRVQPWADRQTGRSPNFWIRAIGWYLMALADTLEACDPQIYEVYAALRGDARDMLKGILRYRDKESGLFYQVVDQGGRQGNYLETSGSCMVACSLLKACRLGILPRDKYEAIGQDIIDTVIDKRLLPKDNPRLQGICSVSGLGPGSARDGSFEYYISEKVVDNDCKGVGALMMACAQSLMLKNKA